MGKEKKIVIDLGSGANKNKDATIAVDNVKLDKVDLVHDILDFPYPFKEESADEVILSHVLEHFCLSDIIRILDEVGRILKTGGEITISVPHFFSIVSATDPGHKTAFAYETLYYFTQGHPAHYRKDLKTKYLWKVKRLWTSVNCFNDHFRDVSPFKRKVSSFCSIILNFILNGFGGTTFADIIVKLSPFWLVSIHAKVCKIGCAESSTEH